MSAFARHWEDACITSFLLISALRVCRGRHSARHTQEMAKLVCRLLLVLLLAVAVAGVATAQTPTGWPEEKTPGSQAEVQPTQGAGQQSVPTLTPVQSPASAQAAATRPQVEWQYGAFVDIAYLLDFNHPANRLFRSRGTTFRVDDLELDMTAAYIRKKPSEQSRWGTEVTVQAGKDSEAFGFSATAPNLAGSKFLRHLGPTDVSYLAPVDKGLTVQGGIFNSLIGYDSLYAKDNFSYTRPWGADFTPYLMMGVNASYALKSNLTATLAVISGYWHLAHANNVPSSVGQLAWQPTGHVTVKQTVLAGPHQRNTDFEFWRFLSDTIAEWKGKRFTAAFEYQYASERVDSPGRPRALWMASQLPLHWNVRGPWSVTLRPEFAWDRNGRWTGAVQTVKAVTTTLEYRAAYRSANAILRLEYRFDDSRGPGGGFFRGAELGPGVVALTPSQHLLIFAAIFTFDSSFHR